jgi:hypothetical protein
MMMMMIMTTMVCSFVCVGVLGGCVRGGVVRGVGCCGTLVHVAPKPTPAPTPRRDRADRGVDEKGKKAKGDKGIFAAGKGSNVLTETEALGAINYRPRHRESKKAYEEILSIIQGNIGDQPQDILRGAADEVLAILKDEKLTDPKRHSEIEKLIRKVRVCVCMCVCVCVCACPGGPGLDGS